MPVVAQLKKIVWLLLIGVIASCSASPQPPLNSITIHDQEQRRLLIEELTKRGVPYLIGENGWIKYSVKDNAVVTSIARNIQRGNRETGIWLSDGHPSKAILLERFKNDGIPYEMQNDTALKGVIVWPKEYDTKVEIIIEELGLSKETSTDNRDGKGI